MKLFQMFNFVLIFNFWFSRRPDHELKLRRKSRFGQLWDIMDDHLQVDLESMEFRTCDEYENCAIKDLEHFRQEVIKI